MFTIATLQERPQLQNHGELLMVSMKLRRIMAVSLRCSSFVPTPYRSKLKFKLHIRSDMARRIHIILVDHNQEVNKFLNIYSYILVGVLNIKNNRF